MSDRDQTVDCQSCGDLVPVDAWLEHAHEHLTGKRPVLGIIECMERNNAARRRRAGDVSSTVTTGRRS